jgi:hypothetical protein
VPDDKAGVIIERAALTVNAQLPNQPKASVWSKLERKRWVFCPVRADGHWGVWDMRIRSDPDGRNLGPASAVEAE